MLTLAYRVTDDPSEIKEAEKLISRRLGPQHVLSRESSHLVVAVCDGRVVACGYITSLTRVDSLVVAEDAERNGISLGDGIAVVDEFLSKMMQEHGLAVASYFTFLEDFSKADRLLELGYTHRPWLVFEKILVLPIEVR